MRLSATLAAALLAATLSCIPAYPLSPEIRDIDVTVTLLPDGTAEVSERWDVCASSGTEWYLVRRNLGDIRIGGLEVSDESGRSYVNEGEWDTDRSISGKAGRCGIVTKDDGAEICWGIGSLGDHVFNVSYSMTRSVKTLSDYDMLHLQTVSPGLSSEPEHVKVTVRALEHRLDTTNTRAWGFGYRGRVDFLDGAVVFESTEPFVRNSSVIVLLRFEKGMFNSPSVQDRSFSDVLATAMEGSDFSGSDDGSAAAGFGKLLGLFMLCMTAMVGVGVWHRHSTRKKILGVKPSEVVWSREIPFGGDLEASARTLDRLGYRYSSDTLAAALILRMVYRGAISVSKDEKGRVELSFNGGSLDSGDSAADELFGMMLQASGSDKVLQHKEFSRWASKHVKKVAGWAERALGNGRDRLRDSGMTDASGYTPAGQENARKLVGLKMFLKDFTLMGEKETIEAVLWQDYLAYGALFGIADKVAEQLRDISPETFREVMDYDYPTMHDLLFQTRILSLAITNSKAEAAAAAASSARGLGGGASFGGGGGFSGGGFGGGSR